MVFGPRYRGLKAWDSSQRPARSRLGRGHGRVLGADRQTAPGDPIELSERGETETAKGKEGKQQKHPGFFHESPRMAFFKKNTRMDGGWNILLSGSFGKTVLCHILRGIGTWGFGYWISCPTSWVIWLKGKKKPHLASKCAMLKLVYSKYRNSTRVTNWWTRSELHLGYMEKWWNGESLPSFIVAGVKIRCSLQGFSIHMWKSNRDKSIGAHSPRTLGEQIVLWRQARSYAVSWIIVQARLGLGKTLKIVTQWYQKQTWLCSRLPGCMLLGSAGMFHLDDPEETKGAVVSLQ